MTPKWRVLALGWGLWLLCFYRDWADWFSLALNDSRYTYTIFAPVLALGWWWTHSRRVAASQTFSWFACGLIAAGAVLALLDGWQNSSPVPSLGIAAAVLSGVGLYGLTVGLPTVTAQLFPIGVMVFMIPPPEAAMQGLVVALQFLSAETALRLFRGIGMPVFREDTFVFALPGVAIEVAEECSGIRSATSLLISSLLAGRLLLDRQVSRIALVALTLPIAIAKNAVRIVTLSWLGVYVDRDFLFGKLHQYGGGLFSILAIVLLGLTILMLRKLEVPRQSRLAVLGEGTQR